MSKTFVPIIQLTEPLFFIPRYECDICGNHFSCKRVITNHLRGVHMKERIFECNLCSKRFSTDSALYMHKKIHDNVLKCVCQGK